MAEKTEAKKTRVRGLGDEIVKRGVTMKRKSCHLTPEKAEEMKNLVKAKNKKAKVAVVHDKENGKYCLYTDEN